MIHPLLRLAATEPHLLGDHVEAYAALVGEEVSKVSTSLIVRARALRRGAVHGRRRPGAGRRRAAVLRGGAVVRLSGALGMFVVPLAPFVIAAGCIVFARSRPAEKPFDTIKKQLNADMAMLREVSAS